MRSISGLVNDSTEIEEIVIEEKLPNEVQQNGKLNGPIEDYNIGFTRPVSNLDVNSNITIPFLHNL